jgi:flagellar biogenesis protein FliO
MRFKVVALILAMSLFYLCGAFAQAQTSTLSMPESTTSSIQEPTPGLPLRKDGVIPQGTLMRVSIAIVIGLVLAIVGAYMLKRYLFARNTLGSSDHHMQLLEVKRLSPRLMLFRVRVNDKTIVLAQSGEQLIELDPGKSFETQQEAIDDEV